MSVEKTGTVGPNPTGRDFVFADIHDCFATIEAALDEPDDDPTRDRAFSPDDLIDYGARSADALEWMQSRFAVLPCASITGTTDSRLFGE